MQKDNRFFEDIARMASGAAGGLLEMRAEMEAIISARVEKYLQKMNFATREEVESLHGMLAKAREEQEDLKKRLESMENRLSDLTERPVQGKKNP